MKNLFLVLLMTLLAFSSCENSTSSNDKKGSGTRPPAGNGNGAQTGTDKADNTPIEQAPSEIGSTKPEVPTLQCEQQPRFSNHQFCTEYKIDKETYLKILQFKSDCTFSATEYQMSNSQVMYSHTGSWKAQGAYLSLNTATSGNAIRKIIGWYGDGIDLNNPAETYSFCD